MERAYDVVVVGAGPGGAAAAMECARLGCGSVALVDKAPLGRPKACGGGLSPRARKVLKEIGLWHRIEGEAYPIHGVRLVSRSGREVTLAGEESASVLVRSRLDRILVEEAIQAGAEAIPETRVERLVLQDGRVVGVQAGGETVRAGTVILASGANAWPGSDARPRQLLHTCIAWFDGVPFKPGILEMIYDPELFPHYGWLFPESANRVNIGICLTAKRLGSRSIRRVFETFLARHFSERMPRTSRVGPVLGHPISTCVRVDHQAPTGLLRVGEANRLANIATGEGIGHAIQSGILAARALADGRSRNRDPERTALEYAGALRRAFEPSFRLSEVFLKCGAGALDGVTAMADNAMVRAMAGRSLARL